MPPNRVRKNRSQKSSTDRRRTRADILSAVALKMVRCTRCKEKQIPDCRVPPGDDTCVSCSRVGNASCDSFGYDDSAVRILVERKRRLDVEEAEANEAIRSANQALVAALATAERLRTQRLALDKKALAMFEQEGEVLAEQERQEAAVAQPTSSGSAGALPFDPSWAQGFSSDDPFLAGVDLSVGFPLVGPGSSGGTPEVSRGS
jgi:hypothetical protein